MTSSPIRTIDHTIHDLIREIRNGELFSYARYGDGEFLSILGHTGNNADEHDWIPELQADLICALMHKPLYRLATVQRYINTNQEPYLAMRNWLNERSLDFEWYEQEVFADSLITATAAGKVAPWLEFLRDPGPKVGSICVVGPEYLKGLRKLFKFDDRIATSDINCYTSKVLIEQDIIRVFKQSQLPILCLLSLSMVAEVVIDDLYTFIRDYGWLIDVGSIWNPYLGRTNRSYWEAMGPAIT